MKPRRETSRCVRSIALVAVVGALLFLVTPAPAHAQCPPNAPYSAEVQQLLESCQAWVCDVTYDPADGYLPENHPVWPWVADVDPGVTVNLEDGKLVIAGPDVPNGLPLEAVYFREEPALLDLRSSIYIIQAQYRVRKLYETTNTDNEILAIMGVSVQDQASAFVLGYKNGTKVVTLGDIPIEADPEYTMEWDWEVDTAYTLLVHRGHQVYLSVDGQPMMTRPWEDMDPDASTLDGMFAFSSGDAEAEYSLVRYCVCQPELTYEGEPVDESEYVPVIESVRNKLVVENLRDTPDPFHPRLEESLVLMDITPRKLPGNNSGKFEYSARITLDVDSIAEERYVKHAIAEVPVPGLATVEGQVSWNGDDNGTGITAADGLYAYKVTVELVRTKISNGKTQVLDTAQSGWRLIVLDGQ